MKQSARGPLTNPPPGPHAFFFDFDGTLYPGESLEEVLDLALADVADRERRVSELLDLGRRGMEGTLPFEQSLRGRLAIARPHRRHIEAWVDQAVGRLRPHWRGLLDALSSAGHTVRVMSGGFRSCIVPVAAHLGLSASVVSSNRFEYGADGWVTGLDEAEPLSRSGGKPETVRSWAGTTDVPGLRVIVGDGATDLEAVADGACDAMIGYGVHAIRPRVRDGAAVFFEQEHDFEHFMRRHFL